MEGIENADRAAAVADRVTPVWDRVLEDAAATAEAYREDGWDAIVCHPGDVTAAGQADVVASEASDGSEEERSESSGLERDDARTGIDVVVPDDEFERAAAAVDGPGAFDEVDVFRAERNGVVFFVAALENAAAETALLVPAYYDLQRAESFLATVAREGELRLHVRPLDRRRVLTFAQADPSPFLPSED